MFQNLLMLTVYSMPMALQGYLCELFNSKEFIVVSIRTFALVIFK